MRIGYDYVTKGAVLEGDGCEKFLGLIHRVYGSSFNDRANVMVTGILLKLTLEICHAQLRGVSAAFSLTSFTESLYMDIVHEATKDLW